MKKPIYIAIVNPHAAGGRCGKKAHTILQNWSQSGVNIQVHETTQPGSATHIARQAYQDGHSHFISVGGDGTSFEIINGLIPVLDSARKPSLGFLPIGTGNSFIKDFSCNPLHDCWQAIKNNQTRPCDMVKLTHSRGNLYFMNIFSFGIIADIGDLRNKYFTRLGDLGYILSTLINLIKVKARTYHYQTDTDTTQQHPATFITFCNSRYTGGNMLIAPHANTHDSLIDIIKMQPCKRLSILKSFPKIFTGEHIKLPFIDETQAQQINFDFMNPVNTLIDGEIINIKPETLTVLPNEISIII